MKNIPKAPTQRAKLRDNRIQVLKDWKKLFKEIDPKIEVFLKEDENFEKVLLEFEFINLYEPYSIDNTRMIVSLPKDFNHSIVLFLQRNIAFSDQDIENDSVYQEDRQLGCEPEITTWEEYYNEIYEEKERMIKAIPHIPKKKKAPH